MNIARLSYFTIIVVAIFSLMIPFNSRAALARVPDIPTPSLPLSKALEVANKQISNNQEYILIAVDWCKASTFQPRVSDGTQYLPAQDDPDGYSWFFTYAYKDKELANLQTRYISILVIRIKDNGTPGVFIGTR